MAGAIACLIVTAVAWVEPDSGSSRVEAAVKPSPRNHAQEASGAILRCPGARSGLEYYKAAYGRHRAVQGLTGPPATRRYGCTATARRASDWRTRARLERFVMLAWLADRRAERERQWDWRSWLPRNWYLVGSCETGYGGPPNWSHANSRFVSAFGISRSIYDSDARYAGMPPWSDSDPPTPWQQYQTALGHFDLYGDGWGCPGP